ncbi:DUF5605 domain-containing protein [Galbitalea soli]|uniref:DUF4038 domain-containing protein n=1 Tax=Galbitalea soli TaxID=1268042 RepID=A0A7C9TRB4_9MICO|nr:DUF5605 domain-containing protein [Galbitalea soli]NEM92056.1 DUF4038 domain-containing protein [Galbitalea soli]NYJ31992.1 hypothetical protein [Galbitalea soli]
MILTADSLLRTALDDDRTRAIIVRHLPGVINSPLALQLKSLPLGQVVLFASPRLGAEAEAAFWRELETVEVNDTAPPAAAPRIEPDPSYEDESVPLSSAVVALPATARVHEAIELVFSGPAHGNPFVDVEFGVTFRRAGSTRRIGGFYDGDGRWIARILLETPGDWEFETDSTARSLRGITGTLLVEDAAPDAHGVVRVADTFHFAHADGTRHLPLGTTAYAWTSQTAELEERTLATLATAPFTKIRMGVFPKSYLFNANEPPSYPFAGSPGAGWDFTRFEPAYFRHLEGRIRELDALGIQCDLILFHPYDRWGFSDMGAAADDRYLQYVVRRLAAFPNVWWSLANEYDLFWAKSVEDWERLAGVVVANDPVGHPLSIHNCFGFYDYSRPWITHCSVQRIDVYRTAENTDEWRTRWGKPIVIDECAYEGDIDQGWGNITGEEMVRRFWEGAVRGGYVGHGETYLNDREELWWSKGGELVGQSPERIGFLAGIIADAPGGAIDPLPGDWDVAWGGVGDEYRIAYLGFGQPRYRQVAAALGRRYTVDVIDTWNMTIDRLPGEFEGSFRVELPGRQFMAIRLIAVE